MIKVILVDDHRIIRGGLRSLLEDEPSITIVGEAENGLQLMSLLESTPVDVIIMDIKMPVMDGFEFLEAYNEAKLSFSKEILIMMLTSSASFYDLERLKQYPEVKKHYSKSLTDLDVKDLMEEYFPQHVTKVD